MLDLIHNSHLGIAKCKQWACKIYVQCYPQMNVDILSRNVVNVPNLKEPSHQKLFLSTTRPPPISRSSNTPVWIWKQVLLADHWLQLKVHRSSLVRGHISSSSVIEVLINQFAWTLWSDCRKFRTVNSKWVQYTSTELAKFCNDYGIVHQMSKAHFQSWYGEVERAVQTMFKSTGTVDRNKGQIFGIVQLRKGSICHQPAPN